MLYITSTQNIQAHCEIVKQEMNPGMLKNQHIDFNKNRFQHKMFSII